MEVKIFNDLAQRNDIDLYKHICIVNNSSLIINYSYDDTIQCYPIQIGNISMFNNISNEYMMLDYYPQMRIYTPKGIVPKFDVPINSSYELIFPKYNKFYNYENGAKIKKTYDYILYDNIKLRCFFNKSIVRMENPAWSINSEHPLFDLNFNITINADPDIVKNIIIYNIQSNNVYSDKELGNI